MWNAERAIVRAPRPYEHVGVNGHEAIKRVADLTFAAERLGVDEHLFAHMKQLAPCLVVSSVGNG